MVDVVLIATICVFFLAAAQLVRALGRVVADPGDADPGDAGPEEELSGQELGPGRPA
jgi:hypothetical protein